MLLPRNRLATCGNNTATTIDNQTKPAILATIPLTKDPLCKQVEVCEVQCEAVGGGRSEMRGGRGARGGAVAAFNTAHLQVESSDLGQRLLKVTNTILRVTCFWHQ